jgi:prevent-host-death family protein
MATKTSKTVNMHEAKTHLSRLVARAQRGHEIIIAKAGKPVAKLVPLDPPKKIPAKAGFLKGAVLYMADDFNAPDPELESLFYDGPIEPSDSEPS